MDQNKDPILDVMSNALANVAPQKNAPAPAAGAQPDQQDPMAAASEALKNVVKKPASSTAAVYGNKSADERDYEARIARFMPEARKRAAEMGRLGSIEAGIRDVPIVGPVVSEIGADIAAALPSSISEAEGDTYSERRKNIKAGLEAQSRASRAQNPLLAGASELGASALLPFGGVAAVGEALTGSKIAGLALEGAGYGGTSALAERVGTKPESEQQSIPGSALEGGLVGGAIGGAFKGLGKVGEMLPDWLKSMGGGQDQYIARQFAQEYDNARQAGTLNMTYPQWLKAKAAGQDVNIYDMFGPNSDFLDRVFKGRKDLAQEFSNSLSARLGNQAERFDSFLRGLTDVELNPDQIRNNAKNLADQERRAAYGAAYEPENGRGFWKDSWTNLINIQPINRALIKTSENLANEASIQRALEGESAATNILDPFISRTVVRANGEPFQELTFTNPNGVNIKYLDTFQRILNKEIDGLSGATEGGLKQQLINLRNDIVDSLTNPNSEFYNAEYAAARNSVPAFREESNAFDYGLDLFKKIRNPQGSSEILNATSQMNADEKKMFTLGVLSDMLTKARVQRAPGQFVLDTRKLNQFFTPGATLESLQNAMPPEMLRDLQRYVNVETTISNAVGAASKLGSRPDYNTQALHNILVNLLWSKPVAIANVVKQMADNYFGRAYSEKIVDQLLSGDETAIRKAYDELLNSESNRGKLSNWIAKNMTGIIGANVGRAEGGRVKRATGGRIPHIDKAFKIAKKELDGITKPILNVHDDDIVKALRVLQGKI